MQRLEWFIRRVTSKIGEDPSEDLDFLLGTGRVEQLVREGRSPFKIGMKGSPENGMQPYYEVPPRGFNLENIDYAYVAAGGGYLFVYKDGSKRVGSTYTLTVEQAKSLEDRVAAERERIRRNKFE